MVNEILYLSVDSRRRFRVALLQAVGHVSHYVFAIRPLPHQPLRIRSFGALFALSNNIPADPRVNLFADIDIVYTSISSATSGTFLKTDGW